MTGGLPGRRSSLTELGACPCTHAGLWFERFLAALDTADAKRQHLEAVASLETPGPYALFFRRWKSELDALAPDRALAVAEVNGRMVVGLGAESILETSILLHRTYGVPYLPGSALKGLAATAADRQGLEAWARGKGAAAAGEAHRILFGETDDAGYVTFHDALWIPEPGSTKLPLDLDVMTVHHPTYYGDGSKPPADWDNPIPIPFLSAHGKYLIALTGPRLWAEAALDLLALALAEEGVGAKTAAGYGRMRLVREEARQRPVETLPRAVWEKQARAVALGNAEREVPRLFDQVAPREHRELALRLVDALTGKALRSEKHRGKAWVQRLWNTLEERS